MATDHGSDEASSEKKSHEEAPAVVEGALPNAASENEDSEEGAYIHGWPLAILIGIIMTGQFIMALDATVLTTALPRITASFHSLDDVGWYGSAYLLLTTATQPIWGRIYSHFDIKRTFVVAILIFELGSVVCAVAPGSAILILGRAIAGLGQSALLAGGVIVIAYRVPLGKRPLYLAMVQGMGSIASVVGPPLGGLFTDSARLTWRFCFWINLPFGVLLLIAGLLYFKSPPRKADQLPLKQKLINLDIPGALLFTFSLVCLFMGFENGGTEYAWSDSRVWGWLIGFAVSMIVFAVLQNRQGETASIPSRIISQRTIAFSCIYTTCIQIGFSTHAYLLPFYFQSAKGVSAQQSGLYLVPYLASIMIVSLVVGALLVATGALTLFMVLGGVMFAVGSGMLTTLQTDSSSGLWIGLQLLTGAGFGSTLQLAIVAIQYTVSQEDLGIGNAIFFLSNFGGGALGVGLAEPIFLNVLQSQLTKTVPQLDAKSIIVSGATAISSAVPADLIADVREAYNVAVTRAFLFPAAVAALATLSVLGMRWINLKK